MASTYMFSYYLGFFIGGMLFGVIPMIIAIVKRQWGIAVAAPLLCGFAAFIHAWASLILGVIFMIVAILSLSNRIFDEEETAPQANPAQIAAAPTDKIPAWKQVEMENQQ